MVSFIYFALFGSNNELFCLNLPSEFLLCAYIFFCLLLLFTSHFIIILLIIIRNHFSSLSSGTLFESTQSPAMQLHTYVMFFFLHKASEQLLS